jgi:hypothetical protein
VLQRTTPLVGAAEPAEVVKEEIQTAQDVLQTFRFHEPEAAEAGGGVSPMGLPEAAEAAEAAEEI